MKISYHDAVQDAKGSQLEDIHEEGILLEGILLEGILPEGILPEDILGEDIHEEDILEEDIPLAVEDTLSGDLDDIHLSDVPCWRKTHDHCSRALHGYHYLSRHPFFMENRIGSINNQRITFCSMFCWNSFSVRKDNMKE